MWGWGCDWPLLGMGIRFLGVVWWHLWCLLGALNSSRPLWDAGGCVLALRAHLPPHPQLVLYCHLHGSATSNLSISYVTSSTKRLMRERMGDLGSSWVRERVDFNVTEPFKVEWCCAEGSWAAPGSGTTAVYRVTLPPPEPTMAVPARTVHPCQPQPRPCSQ